MGTTDHDIHQLARLGITDRSRLRAAGISDGEIRARVAGGSLRPIHPGVYATFGHQLTYEARLLAACRAAGPTAVASHRAALKLWDLLDGVQPLELTVTRLGGPSLDGVIVHHPLDLRPCDVTVRREVPVTNPIRALLDAGAVLPRATVGRCVELALKERLVTVRGLRVILSELGRRGRNGTGPLRTYLDRRALGDRRPESMLEPLMARLIIPDLGIGPVHYQHSLRLSGKTVRPDFLVELAFLAVEVDGLSHHGSRQALDRDHRRTRLLKAHGYEVLPFTATDLRRPAQVTREVVAAAQARIALLGHDALLRSSGVFRRAATTDTTRTVA